MYWDKTVEFNELVGKTLKEIDYGSNEINFKCEDGSEYKMYHEQDCCEGVWIEDICGDMESLIGSPIVMAEESTNSDDPPVIGYAESYTWTFYKLATVNGYVTIRWYGESNGYYSESVRLVKMKEEVEGK